MKNNNYRIIIGLCITLTITLFSIAGCKKKNVDSSNISRAEFAGILGDEFGYVDDESTEVMFKDVKQGDDNYSQIQALASWGVFEETDKFSPNEKTNLKFAIESVVKAIDVDKIEKSGANINKNDLVGFFKENIADIDISDLDTLIDRETANQIISYASKYNQKMKLPQVVETNLKEGVKKATIDIALNADGVTGTIGSDSDYQVGDIVYFEKLKGEAPKAVKIESITNGEFTYINATMEETLDSAVVSGTYDCEVISARSVSDGTTVAIGGENLYNEILNGLHTTDKGNVQLLKNPTITTETTKNGIVCKITDKIDAGKATYSVSITDIKATIDWDYGVVKGLKKADAKISFKTTASAEFQGSYSKTIPLASVELSVAGPVTVRGLLEAHIGADGEMSVTFSNSTSVEIGYKKGSSLRKSVNSEPSMDFQAHANIAVEPSLLLDLRAFSQCIVNAEVTTGVAADCKIDGDILEGTFSGVVKAWVPLRYGINQRSCLVTKIKDNLKYEKEVWNSKTSKIKKEIKFDNGKTAFEKTGDEADLTDENGEQLNELKMFNFEPIKFDYIELASYTMIINENVQGKINISHIPDDYTESDIKYEVTNSDVCSVSSSGAVTAKKMGSTVVKVYTSDNTTAAFIAVTVTKDLAVDFDPL